MQSPASSWGEELGLGEKGEKASHHKGRKNRAEMSHSLSVTSSGCLLLEPEVDCYLNSFFFFEKLLFLQDAHSGLRNAVTHSRVASYCQNGLPPDTCNTNTKPSCFRSS